MKKIKTFRTFVTIGNSILIGCLVLAIIIVNIKISTNLLMNDVKTDSLNTITHANSDINSLFNRIELIASTVVFDSQKQQDILDGSTPDSDISGSLPWDEYDKATELNQVLNSIEISTPEIYSLAIAFNGGKYYGYDYQGNYIGDSIAHQPTFDGKTVQDAIATLIKTSSNVNWILTYDKSNNTKLFTMIRMIVDKNTLNRIGVLVLNIKSSQVDELLAKDKFNNGHVFDLIDKNDIVFSSSNQEYIGQKFHFLTEGQIEQNKAENVSISYDPKDLSVVYQTSIVYGTTLVEITPIAEITHKVLYNQLLIILIGLLGLIASLIFSFVYVSYITRPINELRKAMNEVENGHLSVNIKNSGFIETAELSNGFNHMLQKLKQLIAQVYEEELREREAEFKALQAQINPHFLYNTLDTINCLLIINEEYECSKLVCTLADILRYSIQTKENIVLLHDDIVQIGNYLFIQKSRFGNKLSYELDINADTQDCKILKFLIQPFVENSLVHGIEGKRGPGHIKIRSYLEERQLVITINDDGVGMTEQELNLISSGSTHAQSKGKHTKLGIDNINRRIKMFYGAEYGVTIFSKKGKGTDITIKIPAIKEDLPQNEDSNS
jgi:two-component system sensor histidine kinase YesM